MEQLYASSLDLSKFRKENNLDDLIKEFARIIQNNDSRVKSKKHVVKILSVLGFHNSKGGAHWFEKTKIREKGCNYIRIFLLPSGWKPKFRPIDPNDNFSANFAKNRILNLDRNNNKVLFLESSIKTKNQINASTLISAFMDQLKFSSFEEALNYLIENQKIK